MTLQSAIRGALPALRSEASALMLDTGQALRPTGGYQYVNGVEVPATTPLFGPVSCKIKPPRVVDQANEVGGRTSVVVPAELHLPATPTNAALTVGDIWEITEVSSTSLTKVGRRYRITAEVDGTLVTACRYSVERVVS